MPWPSILTRDVGSPSWLFAANLDLREPASGSAVIEEQIAELRDLAALPGILDQTIGVILPNRPRDYRAFWNLAREVAGLFRSTYLRPVDRERLWAEYSDICRRVKELGLTEREARAAASAVSVERVRALIREASHWIQGGATGTDVAEARARLGQAMDLLKSGDFLNNDRHEGFAAWRKVAADLRLRQAEIRRMNFEAIAQDVRDAAHEVSNGDTFQATGALRQLKAEVQGADVSREQRALLRDQLRELWGILIRRIEARNSERVRLQKERERRQEASQDRLSRRLEDLAGWRDENDRRIKRLVAESEDLEEKIASAWNDGWAKSARGWVQAKYARIHALEARNEELDRQIAGMRDRLSRV